MSAIAQRSAPAAGPQLDNRRALAALVDLAIIAAGICVLAFTFGMVSGDRTTFGGQMNVIFVAWALYYYFAFESGGGQTPGKRLLKLRVVNADGGATTVHEIAVRTVLRLVDGICLYLFGLIVMLVSGQKRQRLGDLAAGTIVVDAGRVPEPTVAGAPTAVAVSASAEQVPQRFLTSESSAVPGEPDRPRVAGKFLYRGGEKLYLRGVTYGTFRSNPDGEHLPRRDVVRRDFAAMRSVGVNTVRTYTTPPEWLLDEAADVGLLVLAGLPWEQHVAFLDQSPFARSIQRRVNEAARACGGHPGLLGYAVGNEIPAPIVRWHGRRSIESFVERLHDGVKEAVPEALVTYVNYPTTEYLQLPFLDFAAFNVYLESRQGLAKYIARLHNLVGDRPLVMTELGIDSRRNGEDQQAETLAWQLDTTFEGGCAGSFVFSWTDEWHRGGHDIDDWDFGVVDRARRRKPALASVEHAYSPLAHRRKREWQRISVVVCTYNGERWLPGCFRALTRLDYPNWELIVVSDGSNDATEAMAREHGAKVIAMSRNEGLSTARNLGYEAARGEIVAYLDDDARPDPDWLRFLALSFERKTFAAVGGPNLSPQDDGATARCVAAAPGGPIHVLVEDEVAEHIPGCNMAFRKSCLEEVAGFDPRFRIAGDDVDICWRLQDANHTIGFNPVAIVWHHRRASVRAYIKQQYEYGKAEALLHHKWPQRYNRLGHLSWAGRVYGRGTRYVRTPRRAKIAYGRWGSHAFQSVYAPGESFIKTLPVLPEWYLLFACLAGLTALGALWRPLFAMALPLAAAVLSTFWVAFAGARAGREAWRDNNLPQRTWMHTLTVALHLAQPMARLAGRLRRGLTPWRRHSRKQLAVPRPRQRAFWSESPASAEHWLSAVESRLQAESQAVVHGTEFDRWDLQVRGGALGVVRLLAAIEEHGGGRQLVRIRWRPRVSRIASALVVGFSALAAAAGLGGAWDASVALASIALAFALLSIYDCVAAAGTVATALSEPLLEQAWAVPGHAGASPSGRGERTASRFRRTPRERESPLSPPASDEPGVVSGTKAEKTAERS